MKSEDYALEALSNSIDSITEQIEKADDREQKALLIGQVNDLRYAHSLLIKCEKYGIKPTSKMITLPDQKCQSPSSDYRIIEDNETDDQKYWSAIEDSNPEMGQIRLHEGDVVVKI